jgi:hypothetical protein
MGLNDDFDIRKQLFEEVKKFNRTEQEELFRILKRADEEMSENRNGIFFDLMSLKVETITKIQDWIKFCAENRSSFEIREKELSDLAGANPGLSALSALSALS